MLILSSTRTLIKSLLIIVGVIFFIAVGWFAFVLVGDNFHAITPGVAYRSGQVGPENLARYVARYGIRSVINLRSKVPERRWYQEEVAACRKLHIEHYNFGLSASKAASPDMLDKLARLFKKVPQPVLIHCKSGADRSGLGSAMWQVAIEGKPPAKAKKAFSLRFGHVYFSRAASLRRSFDKWALRWNTRLAERKIGKKEKSEKGK
ncbi:MAG: dual specificity protein phosphatase family protein [Holophagae bacterium]|nr:dual specificity protein phosphatase family protein [Holophagae bacterium]